jgi:hypothetical protein
MSTASWPTQGRRTSVSSRGRGLFRGLNPCRLRLDGRGCAMGLACGIERLGGVPALDVLTASLNYRRRCRWGMRLLIPTSLLRGAAPECRQRERRIVLRNLKDDGNITDQTFWWPSQLEYGACRGVYGISGVGTSTGNSVWKLA